MIEVIAHSLLIWPFETAVEFLYLVLNQWTDHHVGVTVVLLSLTVSTLILPLYRVTDGWQKEERAAVSRMAAKLADIRAVFRGDERQLMISTFYRQQGYHPLLSLRSSVGLLLQVPFFLAAYNVLSHAGGLKTSVSIIQDFSLPDRLLHIGDLYINVLPLVMTAINLLSAAVYAKGMRPREYVQLGAVSLVFLVLLYNSPSGLVLYWTVNNLFSLAKNIVSRLPRPGRVFHVLVFSGVAALVGWSALTHRPMTIGWAVEAAAVLMVVLVLPWLWRLVVKTLGRDDSPAEKNWFRASSALLFLLSGVAIPVFFAAASPADVPQAGEQIFRTVLQMFSLFVLLPTGLWAMASVPVRKLLAWGLGALAVSSLISAFVFAPGGSFNASFTLNDPQALENLSVLGTAVSLGLAAVLVVLAVLFRLQTWMTVSLTVSAVSLLLSAGVTLATFRPTAEPEKHAAATTVSPVFHLTKSGQNQFMIFIDGFPAPVLREILSTLPGFEDSLQGFTWYANTVSSAPQTLQTTPAMMGGARYTPEAINARPGVPLVQKHNEGLRAMPALMGAAGERVVLTDPWYINFSGERNSKMFDDLPGVASVDLHGLYSDLYFKAHPYAVETSAIHSFDYDILSRLSFFRMAPPAFRKSLYDNGQWWVASSGSHISDYVLGGYPNLTFLAQLCVVDEGANTANFFFSEVFHDSGAFDAEGRLQSQSVEVRTDDLERYGNVFSVRNVYDARAVMESVRQWLEWLKESGVYDQTRIMIVSDHGHPISEEKFGARPWYRPLILFKDYHRRGPLEINEDLKTNADVPVFLTAGMPGAIAPREGEVLVYDGPNSAALQAPDSFVLTRTMRLARPDSREAENWVEVKP